MGKKGNQKNAYLQSSPKSLKKGKKGKQDKNKRNQQSRRRHAPKHGTKEDRDFDGRYGKFPQPTDRVFSMRDEARLTGRRQESDDSTPFRNRIPILFVNAGSLLPDNPVDKSQEVIDMSNGGSIVEEEEESNYSQSLIHGDDSLYHKILDEEEDLVDYANGLSPTSGGELEIEHIEHGVDIEPDSDSGLNTHVIPLEPSESETKVVREDQDVATNGIINIEDHDHDEDDVDTDSVDDLVLQRLMDNNSTVQTMSVDAVDDDDVSDVPDEALFFEDTAGAIEIDDSMKEEILLAPRRLNLSSSGVSLEARSLEMTMIESISRVKIIDEPFDGVSLGDNLEHVQQSQVAVHKQIKNQKKKKNRMSKSKNRNKNDIDFKYIARKLSESENDDQNLDDYIQNLYDMDEPINTSLLVDESEVYDILRSFDDNYDNSEENGYDNDVLSSSESVDVIFSAHHNADNSEDDDLLNAEERYMSMLEFATEPVTNSRNKNAAPQFNDVDSDLKQVLKDQWLKDKQRKKAQKKEREQLRNEGLLGKKARKSGKADLKAKYKSGMRISEVRREIESFLSDAGKSSLPLPPMDKSNRKASHILAANYGLKSKSIGEGKDRFTILYKSTRTSDFKLDYRKIKSIEDRILRRMDNKSGKQYNNVAKSGGGKAQVKLREGDIVGNNAPEIGSENFGRRLLERMGWKSGTGLGVKGNVGMAVPIMATVKTSKAGLG
ncbi:hypothetical protein V1511DRAFT_495485 [Dipodascopsis uninucleata]